MAARARELRAGAGTWLPHQLLGEARANALRERARGCVDEWQQRWFGHTVEFELSIVAASGRQVGGSLCVTAHEYSQGPVLQMGVTAELLPRLLGLRGMTGPAGSAVLSAALAQALQLDLLRDLGATLLQLAGLSLLPAPTGDAGSEEHVLTRGWHQVSCTLLRSLERLELLLHPALIEGLAPPQRSRSFAAVASRRSAVAREPVRVEAWLGEARLTLSELATLRPGDVLVLDNSQAMQLTTHDRQRIATLQLGRRRRQRVVSIANVNNSNLQGEGNPPCQ
jgi:hypothetical protein